MKEPLVYNEIVDSGDLEFQPRQRSGICARRRVELCACFVVVVMMVVACAVVALRVALIRAGETSSPLLTFDVDETELDEEKYKDRFFAFIDKYRRVYGSREESNRRFHIYIANMKEIEEANMIEEGEFEENEFTDWTEDELKKLLLPYKKPDHHRFEGMGIERARFDDDAITRPEEFDWRTKNVVTPVKSQVAIVESAYAIKTGKLLSLSEQELIDCDDKDMGCDGGYRPYAFRFVKDHGLTAEKNYPYCGKQQDMCNPYNGTVFIDRVVNLGRDEEKYADYLFEHGPISIGMNVTKSMFNYKSGIFNPSPEDCEQHSVGSHALAVVGYGKLNDVPYWLVKNSWGQSWGIENGYFYIKRGVNACGLALEAYTAAIDKA